MFRVNTVIDIVYTVCLAVRAAVLKQSLLRTEAFSLGCVVVLDAPARSGRFKSLSGSGQGC